MIFSRNDSFGLILLKVILIWLVYWIYQGNYQTLMGPFLTERKTKYSWNETDFAWLPIFHDKQENKANAICRNELKM
jgi:hypothetical protein